MLVDDPLTPRQALSPKWRQRACEWFEQQLLTRLNDKGKGKAVLVMQRLHEEDVAGQLMRKGGWEVVELPAIAGREYQYYFQENAYSLAEGSLLHPEREPAPVLHHLRQEMGEAAFSAQYLQQPLHGSGDFVASEWFSEIAEREAGYERIVQSWDTAIKAEDKHDASVCITFGEVGEEVHILDVAVMRLAYPRLRLAMCSFAEDFGAEIVLVEDKASGQALLQEIKTMLPGVAFIGRIPKWDKSTRFARASSWLEAGKVKLWAKARGLFAFKQELLAFPHGSHDDQVDSFSQYVQWRMEGAFHGTMRRL